MWLLHTARAELKFFPTPESVPGGYVILSHVWDEHEQTFQEIQAIRDQCSADGSNPRDLVCDKVREFCVLAERGGHEWGWADMCCIDKTSSTELSEAIVSMYRYYSLADVCYVYLRDVPTSSPDELRAIGSAFWESRWHRRGWTLQELIAPFFVIFLSSTWEPLAAKADLADTLEEITRVPSAVLKLDAKPSAYCVAARMSWAANRETTRPEDEAYCLMGIFGIFMSPLYGEGGNAFLRLQEEIMRHVDDPSIFAWGYVDPDPVDGSNICQELNLQARDWTMHADSILNRNVHSGDLFASSPSDFLYGHRMKHRTERTDPPSSRRSFWGKFKRSARFPDLSKLATFTITSYGIMAHVPVFATRAEGVLMALLLGVGIGASDGILRNLGIFLREATTSPDPTRPLYTIVSGRPGYTSARLYALGRDPLELAARYEITLEWRTIYIRRSSRTTDPESPGPTSSGLQVFSQSLHAPFHIPHSHVKTLLQCSDASVAFRDADPRNATASSLSKYAALNFEIEVPGQAYPLDISIHLGLCTRSSPNDPQHWAMITGMEKFQAHYTYFGVNDSQSDVQHVCAEHHVDVQPRQTKSFTLLPIDPSTDSVTLQIQVELSFEPYVLNPNHVRTVHVNFDSVHIRWLGAVKTGIPMPPTYPRR